MTEPQKLAKTEPLSEGEPLADIEASHDAQSLDDALVSDDLQQVDSEQPADDGQPAGSGQSLDDAQSLDDDSISADQVIDLLNQLLNDRRIRPSDELEEVCQQYPKLRETVETILELRSVTTALSKGALNEIISSHGYVLSSIKALQSNLNHLVWQLNQVSKGDFSQRIDFLGEFSHSFNAMCEKLEGQKSVLVELARHDGLTQLANRQYLDEYMESLFDGVRKSDTEFSLLMFDLDYFKMINDTYGHDVGDLVLEQTARHFRYLFRSTDFLARYGGEEFVVILPHVALEQAKIIGDRALEYIERHPITLESGEKITVTASVGITEATSQDTSPDQVLKRSDKALYRAKHAGRNRSACA